jgi:hypothetical protein
VICFVLTRPQRRADLVARDEPGTIRHEKPEQQPRLRPKRDLLAAALQRRRCEIDLAISNAERDVRRTSWRRRFES